MFWAVVGGVGRVERRLFLVNGGSEREREEVEFFSLSFDVFFQNRKEKRRKREKERERRLLRFLFPFYFHISALLPRAPVLLLRPRVLSPRKASRSPKEKQERRSKSKEPMRLSLAALAQIGRLPTPPAAALEAVSSETKVRDFFREVRE